MSVDAGLTGNVADAAANSGQQVEGQPVADQQNSDSSGINPAWNELFGVLPTSLQPLVTPHLKKWEDNSQRAIQQATEQFKPWEPLAGKYDPQMVQGLLQLIESDPQQLITTLQEFHGLTPAQQQQVSQQVQQQTGTNPADVLDLDSIGQPQEFDLESNPQFVQLKQQNEQLMQMFQQQAQEKIQQTANAQIDAEIKALQDKHGDFDVTALLAFAQTVPNLQSLEQAWAAKDAYDQSVLKRQASNSAPPVLPSFGGAPSAQPANVAALKPQQRRDLVAEILSKSHASD